MSKSKQLLIVEDEVSIRKFFREIFDDYCDVELAANGKEAYKLLEKIVPDIIILDIMMPEVSGFDVLKTIRKDEKFNRTIIIIVTALNDMETKRKAIKEGADDVVHKPFNISYIRTKVQLMFRLRDRLLDK